jgi:hypothetical protein
LFRAPLGGENCRYLQSGAGRHRERSAKPSSLIIIWSRQGDQIGRVFAHWAIAYFGQLLTLGFFIHIHKWPRLLGYFFHRSSLCLMAHQGLKSKQK